MKVVAGIWGNFLDFAKISLNLFVGRHWYYLTFYAVLGLVGQGF